MEVSVIQHQKMARGSSGSRLRTPGHQGSLARAKNEERLRGHANQLKDLARLTLRHQPRKLVLAQGLKALGFGS